MDNEGCLKNEEVVWRDGGRDQELYCSSKGIGIQSFSHQTVNAHKRYNHIDQLKVQERPYLSQLKPRKKSFPSTRSYIQNLKSGGLLEILAITLPLQRMRIKYCRLRLRSKKFLSV